MFKTFCHCFIEIQVTELYMDSHGYWPFSTFFKFSKICTFCILNCEPNLRVPSMMTCEWWARGWGSDVSVLHVLVLCQAILLIPWKIEPFTSRIRIMLCNLKWGNWPPSPLSMLSWGLCPSRPRAMPSWGHWPQRPHLCLAGVIDLYILVLCCAILFIPWDSEVNDFKIFVVCYADIFDMHIVHLDNMLESYSNYTFRSQTSTNSILVLCYAEL
jgi:hypothetical protein